MSQTVVLKVKMSCCGCSGAVKRVLDKMEGVKSYDINMDEQKVTVKGNVQAEDVFQTVSKSGKKTEFWVDAPPAETETKAEETETKPTEAVEAETKPTEVVEAETKPTEAVEAETKPTEAVETETKPAEAVETETKSAEAVAAS